MGVLISRLVKIFYKTGEQTICMLGLDNAGKTTILYKIKINATVTTVPTIGFNLETVSPVKGVTFTVWDVGGQDRIRQLWRHYCNSCDGLLYVVDSTDMERMEEAREELFNMLEIMRDVPVVVLANKQDNLGAMTATEVTSHLYLNKLTVQETCALTGEGLYKAMKQMATLIKESKTSK